MRDTIILASVLAGIVFGVIHMRRTASTNTSFPSNPTAGLHSKKVVSRGRHQQGDPRERTAYEQSFSSEAPRASQGDSGETENIASVASIYSQPDEAKERRSGLNQTGEKKRSAIGGFDSASYVATRNDRLRYTHVVGPTDEGLHVVLMCMELRGEHVESKSAADCRALYRDNVAITMNRR